MRTRNNKLINFILEISQVILMFLGVYSAIMCMAASLELVYDRLMCMLIMLLAAILFYGLFTVLETFHKGKLYGLLGISLFFVIIITYFRNPVKKGFIMLVNSFLKEFMDFSGSKLTLLSYNMEEEGASIYFCTTLVLILLGVYLIALISAFFYRRRRPLVFLAATLPIAFLSLAVGRVGYFANVFTYMIVTISVVGTRHLKTDATDRRMRQKLSILLMLIGLAAGTVSYICMPPQRYEDRKGKLTETKNSIAALMTWSGEDVFSWIKSHFNEDTIDYGKVGGKKEVTYTGEPVLKISGTVNDLNGMYLRGYVGDIYEDNQWSSRQEEEYLSELARLDAEARSPNSWHLWLRNNLDVSDFSNGSGIDFWATANIRIRNVGFGYGNYVVPYLPTNAFMTEENGKTLIGSRGIDYTVEYYLVFPHVMRHDILQRTSFIGNNRFWEDHKVVCRELESFAKKYYLQVPESLAGVCNEFKQYLNENGGLYDKFQNGTVPMQDIFQAVKTYITRDTEYTLAPGETPSGRDTVEYFLKENKKGYCTYYATTAAVLLRSVGIPTRYAEGLHISVEELSVATEKNTEILVPDSDAHAWVEVFDTKYGFVPMEVTPGVGEDVITQSTDSKGEDQQKEDTKKEDQKDPSDETKEEPEMATPTPAVTQEPEESMIFDDIEGNEDPEEGSAGNTGGSSGNRLPMLLLQIGVVLVVVAAALEGERRIRYYLFMKSLHKLRMKRRIRKGHRHLMPVFNARGAAYRGQSMAEYAVSIAEAMDLPPDQIAEYVGIVYHARFGPDDVTEAQYAGFRMQYDMIRKKMYEDAKIIKKLYYMYIMVL